MWLLGDSGYPQRPWLMTPILNAAPNTPQSNYNQKHMRARVVIENTFGRLKNRWRCLNKDRALHYKPVKCARIILACCVLHNIGINYDTVDDADNIDLENDDDQGHDEIMRETSSTADLIRGRVLRDQLVRRLYQQ
uniref:DDE Tnp4 domain-containing protein n=2 Tax=Bombyx TaxID=7090 RepID=A0A8R2LYC9_BOMMO|nr:putative nuclease HARBI1 [Bombyx mori]